MKKAILLPFKRVTADDGSEWVAAWGLEDADIALASAYVGVELSAGDRVGTICLVDPKHRERHNFQVYDCESHLWAYTELSNGVWAQAIRGKSAPAPKSIGNLIWQWLSRR